MKISCVATHGPEMPPLWLCHFERLTHLSLFTTPLPLSPLTNHFSPITAALAALAVRLQDLFIILSQGVDLGLLPITAAFGSARDLKQILGSGFEIVRISQCESPRVCGFMIKKGQSGDQIDDHNRGADRHHPEAF